MKKKLTRLIWLHESNCNVCGWFHGFLTSRIYQYKLKLEILQKQYT